MPLKSVQVTGADVAAATILSVGRVPVNVMDGMAALAFATMRAGAGRHSPRPQGTGRLFASLNRQGAGALTQIVGHDRTQAPHAEWVIFGSRPHAIRPRNAKVLSWIGPNGRVFARSVWHPGYIGDNYRDDAVEATMRALAGIVDNALGS